MQPGAQLAREASARGSMLAETTCCKHSASPSPSAPCTTDKSTCPHFRRQDIESNDCASVKRIAMSKTNGSIRPLQQASFDGQARHSKKRWSFIRWHLGTPGTRFQSYSCGPEFGGMCMSTCRCLCLCLCSCLCLYVRLRVSVSISVSVEISERFQVCSPPKSSARTLGSTC